MRNYIDILNESMPGQSAEALLRKVLAAWEEPDYGDPEAKLDTMSQVMDEVRAALGIEDMANKSLDYRRGRNDAYHGQAFNPPVGGTSNQEYKDGWTQGRREKGL